MDPKVIVQYDWDGASHSKIYLAVTAGAAPQGSDWRPAYRDHMPDPTPRRYGAKPAKRIAVVWARFPMSPRGTVWLRDQAGVRKVRWLS